ncbi:MAG: hypothetical protein V4710_10605 [Verrucomicrobiota bacterium]
MNTFVTKPQWVPELDPDFQPAVLWNRAYLASVGDGVPLMLALEGEQGRVSRYETMVRSVTDDETLRYVERLVKFLLWSRGGWRLVVAGPEEIAVLKRLHSRVNGDLRLVANAILNLDEVLNKN